MTTYAWSTITTTQGLTFTSADSLAFDLGGGAVDVQVSISAAVTTLIYSGKSVIIQNAALTGSTAQFLFLDGSHLGVDAFGLDQTITLPPRPSQYVSSNDTSFVAIDHITGGDAADVIHLGAGADTAFGGAGDDTITGDLGDDTLVGWIGNDSLSGGAGNDSLAGSGGHDAMDGGDGNDTLVSGPDDSLLLGGAGADSLVGGSGADTLDGGDGADYLWGGAGGNSLVGGAGNDILDSGGDGNSVLSGGDGDDFLYARGGSDTLDGGAGSDTLTGGAGADLFVFDAVTDSTNSRPDLIVDFQHGVDKIDLHKIDPTLAWGGSTPTAHGVWYTISGPVTVIHIDTHTSYVGSDATINLYGTNLGLTAADFVL